MPTSPRRRWFQFGLRTMFVAVTVVAIFIGYHVNWIRQRNAERTTFTYLQGLVWSDSYDVNPAPEFPWSLRLFGEKPEPLIYIATDPKSERDRQHLERVSRLFPESRVVGTERQNTK
jgi:hypothetical protein